MPCREALSRSGIVPESGMVINLESESISLTFSSERMIIARQRKGVALEVENVGLTVKDRTTGDPKDLLSDISLAVLPENAFRRTT